MSGIGVITNPRSRRNKRDPLLASRLGYILGEKGAFETPGDRDELDAAAMRFRERGIDVLCVNGGDGTLHTALTALVRAYGDLPLPRIALLRGGTMNTIAHGLGIRGRASDLLEWVVGRYHADVPMATVRRSTLRVDGNVGFLFGNGLIAHFLEAYYEAPEPSPFSAAVLLARASVSAVRGRGLIERITRPYVGSVEVDGLRWPEERWLTVAAGTVDDIGLGFRPFFLAPGAPGRLHALGLACGAADVVRNLPRVFRARPFVHPHAHDGLFREMVLRSEEPISYMVDGDFHRGGRELRVEIGPSVEFVLPDR